MATQIKDENEIKVFILYLLDKIGYPLDYPTIGSIVMQDGVINFFDFATCFFDLLDKKLIKETLVEKGNVGANVKVEEEFENSEAVLENNYTLVYEVTENGASVANTLQDNVMKAVRESALRSALRHLDFAKQGANADLSFRQEGKGYLVNCTIKDRKGVMMDVTLRADNEVQLEKMRNNFGAHPEVVYRGIVALLAGDVNYIFKD